LSDKNPEPSEVLWVGFPAQLKVDESILGRAFAPFGEIEKISTFPGRSYAFVRYSSVASACRALEALQGKLFGNPRVHICFAKSESGSSSSGKSSFNGPRSPSYKSSGRGGSSRIGILEILVLMILTTGFLHGLAELMHMSKGMLERRGLHLEYHKNSMI
jgi:RNA recognition motif-containing protein